MSRLLPALLDLMIFYFLFPFPCLRRDFRLVLREDPSSIYVRDVEIENTEGPVDFDLSRVYTGIVEGK